LLLLCVFLHGMIFRSSVYANTAALDRAAKIPGYAKLAALLSLLLWAGIACAGRAIGYVEPPLERIHAGFTHGAVRRKPALMWRAPVTPCPGPAHAGRGRSRGPTSPSSGESGSVEGRFISELERDSCCSSSHEKWQAVENSALALAEAANLLTIPGRKFVNGRDVGGK
jgi:hypothetical protein